MSSLSNSAFKATKSLFEAKLDVSTPVASFNYLLLAQFDKSHTSFTLSQI